MPAAPELGDRAAGIGPVEVLGEADAEHPRHADRHVGIAGEVEIDLQRVGDRADPGADEIHFARRRPEHGIGDRRDIVRDHHLLEQPMGEPRHAGGEIVDRQARANEVADHVAEPDDRTRDQVRKEALIGGIARKVLLGLYLAPAHIHQVRDGLEHEERDARRQRDARRPCAEIGAEQRIQILRDEVGVFEPEQGREVDQDQDRQRDARGGARQPQRAGEIDDDDGDQDERARSRRPVVEGEADQEDRRQERPAPREQDDRKRGRQEQEYEIRRRKDHVGGGPPGSRHWDLTMEDLAISADRAPAPNVEASVA